MEKKELDIIRRSIQTCKGEKVRLTSRRGRKRTVVHEGVIEETYDNVFVVCSDNNGSGQRKITFSYTDVVTKAVEFILYKNDQKLRLMV